MVGYLFLFNIFIIGLIIFVLIKNINNKKIKNIILIAPIVLSAILYFSIMLLTSDLPPYACDGAALMGILISFVFLGIGILVNIINVIHLIKRR